MVEQMSRQSGSKSMQPRKYLEAVLMLAAALGVVLITVGTQAAFAKVPQFKDYAVGKVHSGQIAQPDLNSHPDARTYRTRLRNAARGAVNFAGKYVLVQWGCGTTCVYGALLEAESGKVIFLPFSVCCWTGVDDSFQPIEVRPNSRLIVFAGLRGEKEPMGAHFYEFRGDEFVFLETVETGSDFQGVERKESEPISQSSLIHFQRLRDSLVDQVTPETIGFHFNYSLEPSEKLGANEVRSKLEGIDLSGWNVSLTLKGSTESGWVHLRANMTPTLCRFTVVGIDVCYFFTWEHTDNECRVEYDLPRSRENILVCKRDSLYGTGIYGVGELFFALTDGFPFLGFLPTYERFTSSFRNMPSGVVYFKAENEIHSEGETAQIRRCVNISFSPDGDELDYEDVIRCEDYNIDFENHKLTPVSLNSSIGKLLMDLYEDEAKQSYQSE